MTCTLFVDPKKYIISMVCLFMFTLVYLLSAELNSFINVSTNTIQIKGEPIHLNVDIKYHIFKTNDNIKEPQLTNNQCMLTNNNYH